MINFCTGVDDVTVIVGTGTVAVAVAVAVSANVFALSYVTVCAGFKSNNTRFLIPRK